MSPLHVASRSFSGRSPPSIQTLYLRHWWIETCKRLVWLSYSIHSVQAHCSYSESHTSNRYSKHVEALLKTHSCVFSHSIKRRGLPLSAVSVSLHHTPGCLRSTDTCDRTPSAMFEGNFWRFVDVSLLRNEDQPQKKLLPVSQPARQEKERAQVHCKLLTARNQNSEPGSCAVWVSYRTINCHCKNYINKSESRFWLHVY